MYEVLLRKLKLIAKVRSVLLQFKTLDIPRKCLSSLLHESQLIF
jgi:hypothetical protein